MYKKDYSKIQKKKIIVDFYRFIMHDIFIEMTITSFYHDSELATENKFEKIRAWEKLFIKDYKLPICF